MKFLSQVGWVTKTSNDVNYVKFWPKNAQNTEGDFKSSEVIRDAFWLKLKLVWREKFLLLKEFITKKNNRRAKMHHPL